MLRYDHVFNFRPSRIRPWILALSSLFISLAPVHASELARCLESALVTLTEAPLMSQNDPALLYRSLIHPGSESMMCGPTCGVHLMEAVRKALKIRSVYHSQAEEAEALAKVGYFFGRDVAKAGMNLENLRTAIRGDLTQHGISASMDGLSLVRPSDKIKKVTQIRLSDLEVPSGVAQATIVIASSSEGRSHALLVQRYFPERQIIVLIDPQNPGKTLMLPLAENARTQHLHLVHPLAPSEVADQSPYIESVLRVRLDSSQPLH